MAVFFFEQRKILSLRAIPISKYCDNPFAEIVSQLQFINYFIACYRKVKGNPNNFENCAYKNTLEILGIKRVRLLNF